MAEPNSIHAPLPDGAGLPLGELVGSEVLPLTDHHCHPITGEVLDRPRFEGMLTEARTVSPLGTSLFDSMLGLVVRRWCAPVLGLPPHTPAAEYLARRAELGAGEVNRRFLAAAGIGEFLVDTGLTEVAGTTLGPPGEPAALCGGRWREIVRLERVAEEVARDGGTAEGFAAAVRTRLADRTAQAAAVKSIAAYRGGLAIAPRPPSRVAVAAAAGRLLSTVDTVAAPRIADPVLHDFLAWQGIELGLPVQFHVGYGDADLDLRRADPALLTGFLRATKDTGVPVLLLHNYPFHRQAAQLAQVFEHVFADLSLATHAAGARAEALLAELLELAPFGKVLFASDACGLAELYLLGAVTFRRALGAVLARLIDGGDLATADAPRIARLLAFGNAARVYPRTGPGMGAAGTL